MSRLCRLPTNHSKQPCSPATAGVQTDPDARRDPASIGSALRVGSLLATGLRRYGSGPRPSPGSTEIGAVSGSRLGAPPPALRTIHSPAHGAAFGPYPPGQV